MSGLHSIEREKQIKDTAAWLGVADFVYSARPLRKGNALREASGDGLLIVGERGAILQVKSRDPKKARLDSPSRTILWVQKQARKARDQGLGAKREIARRRSLGDPVIVSPVRAAALSDDSRRRYEFEITGYTQGWPIIVVLDHPACPELDLGFERGIVWLLSTDWKELHYRIRSISGLLEYCERIMLDSHHVCLGREIDRYAAMRAADVKFVGNSPTSVPYLQI